jgi:hypothetical protein
MIPFGEGGDGVRGGIEELAGKFGDEEDDV